MHSDNQGFKEFVSELFVDRTLCCTGESTGSIGIFHFTDGCILRVTTANSIAQLSGVCGAITRVQHFVQRHRGIYTYRLYVWTDTVIWKTEVLRIDGNDSGYSIDIESDVKTMWRPVFK